jgi:hypothetical protein
MDAFGAVDVVKVLSRIIGGRATSGASGRPDEHVGKPGADSRAGSLSLSPGGGNGWVKIDHLRALRFGLHPPHPRRQILCCGTRSRS